MILGYDVLPSVRAVINRYELEKKKEIDNQNSFHTHDTNC